MRNIFHCSVISAGIAVNYVSDMKLYDTLSDIAEKCFIPEISVLPTLSNTTLTVNYRNNFSNILTFDNDNVSVEFPWDFMQNGLSLIYISYPLIEKQRQTFRSLTAHAACVSMKGIGVLLLGKEGAGKSSVAIEMCRKLGAKLVANDLCVLGMENTGLHASGGTKFLFLRKESAIKNLPDLVKFFLDSKSDDWRNKTIIPPKDIAISTENEKIPISGIYLVHVDNQKSEVYTEKDNGIVTKLYLNENFSRYIRSTCTMIVGGSDSHCLGWIPPMDNPKFHLFRMDMINWITERLTYISGPLEKIVHFIKTNQEI